MYKLRILYQRCLHLLHGQGPDRQRRLRRQDPRVLPGRHRDRAPRQDALHGPHDAHARPAPRRGGIRRLVRSAVR